MFRQYITFSCFFPGRNTALFFRMHCLTTSLSNCNIPYSIVKYSLLMSVLYLQYFLSILVQFPWFSSPRTAEIVLDTIVLPILVASFLTSSLSFQSATATAACLFVSSHSSSLGKRYVSLECKWFCLHHLFYCFFLFLSFYLLEKVCWSLQPSTDFVSEEMPCRAQEITTVWNCYQNLPFPVALLVNSCRNIVNKYFHPWLEIKHNSLYMTCFNNIYYYNSTLHKLKHNNI